MVTRAQYAAMLNARRRKKRRASSLEPDVPANPDTPYYFTLTAADLTSFLGTGAGYLGSAATGGAAVGEISREPVPEYPLRAVVDGGGLKVIDFPQAIGSLLDDAIVWINGVEHPGIWSNSTTVARRYTFAEDPGFEPGETYNIAFVIPEPEPEVITRPYGLAYQPAFAGTAYEPSSAPADALVFDAGTHTDLPGAIAAARAAGVALLLPPGTYEGVFEALEMPHGIYADGPLGSVVISYSGPSPGNSTPAFGYLTDRDFTCKGVEFRNFGDVFCFCVGSVDRGSGTYFGQDESHDRFMRAVPAGTLTGVGVEIDSGVWAKTLGTEGPTVEITDNRFVNCERTLFAVSDTTILGPVNYHRNDLKGTWGGVEIYTTTWGEFYAANNYWHDCVGSRQQQNIKTSGLHTLFRIGGEFDGNHRSQIVRIENNLARNIKDAGTQTDINSAVFADVRGGEATNYDKATLTADLSISFNQIIDCNGLNSQIDSNAIYTKIRCGVIEGNYIENTGSDNSETTGILCKVTAGDKDPGMFTAIVGNTFKDMPVLDASTSVKSVIKVAETGSVMDVVIAFNTIINTPIVEGAGAASAHIKTSDQVGVMWAFGNRLVNSPIAAGYFIRFPSLSHATADKSDYEISNNRAVWGPDVDYTEDLTLINIAAGGSEDIVTGHNVLEGSGGEFDMLMDVPGNGLAEERVYTPSAVEPQSLAAFAFGVPPETATENVAYAGFRFFATGGVTPYTFSVQSGALPDGLSLSSDGYLSGTPTVPGAFNDVVVRVTDDAGATADLPAFDITINAAATPATVSFGAHAPSSANATFYEGTVARPATAQWAIISGTCVSAASAAVSSVTIDGVAAEIVIEHIRTVAGAFRTTFIAKALVPGADTEGAGDIIARVDYASTAARGDVAVRWIDGTDGTVVHSNYADIDEGQDGALNLNVVQGGVTVAHFGYSRVTSVSQHRSAGTSLQNSAEDTISVGVDVNADGTFSWVGVPDEDDFDAMLESGGKSHATLVAASFAPSGA